MKKFLVITLMFVSLGVSQETKHDAALTNNVQPQNQTRNTPPKKISMEEALKNTKEIPGLITLYQDTTKGKLYMLVKKDHLDKEYIHFIY